MTIQPFRISRTKVVANFNAAASACLDTVGVGHTVRIDFSHPTGSGSQVFLTYSEGTGIHELQDPYGADWRIPGASPGPPGIVVLSVPTGVSSFTFPIQVNDNHDASELYKMRIVGGVGISAGTTEPLHTVTCTTGVTRPTSANTGPSGSLTVTGDLNITNGQLVVNKEAVGDCEFIGPGTFAELRNSWIRLGGVYAIKRSGGAWTAPGILIKNVKIGDEANYPTLNGADSAGVQHLGFMTLEDSWVTSNNADGIKAGTDTTILRCFVEKLFDAPGGEDAHTDAIQAHDGGARLLIQDSNLYLPYPGTPEALPGQYYESNAAIIVDGSSFNGVTIQGNWLVGGNYTVYLNDAPHSDVVVKNNQMSTYNGGWSDPQDMTLIETRLFSIGAGTNPKISGCKWLDGPRAGQPITMWNNTRVWA